MRILADEFDSPDSATGLTKEQVMELYARDITRLLNELEGINNRIAELERRHVQRMKEYAGEIGRKKLRSRPRVTDNTPNS